LANFLKILDFDRKHLAQMNHRLTGFVLFCRHYFRGIM